MPVAFEISSGVKGSFAAFRISFADSVSFPLGGYACHSFSLPKMKNDERRWRVYLTSIRLTSAASIFGISIARTPSLKLASTFSLSTSVGSGIDL